MKIFIIGLLIILLLFILFIVAFPVFHEPDSRMTRKYATKMDIETIASQIEQYKNEYGLYPERLKDLVPKYLKKVPLDVWGKEYMLEVSKSEYRLYTHY